MGGRAEDAVSRRLLLLLPVLAAAAFLRFDALHEPSYWLDEILYDQLTSAAAGQPMWQWLTSSHAEHAGLYYLTQLVMPPRVAAALFGLATIVVVWLITRELEPRAALAAAVLLAVSPLHVYYSREARSYALLMLLTAVMVLLLLQARSLAAFVAVLVAMLYTAALSAPVVLAAAIVAAACALVTRKRWYWKAAAAAVLTLPLFRLLYSAKPYEETGWPSFPPLDAAFFRSLLHTFTVSALSSESGGRIAVVVLALAVIGGFALARRNAVAAVVVIGMTVAPLVAAIVSLKALDHFFVGRYVTPALIGFVVLAATGLCVLMRMEVLAVAAAVAIASQTWAVSRNEPFQKLDWRQIAHAIWSRAKPGEVVIAAEPWSEVSLRYYLGRLPPKVKLVHIFAPEVAEVQRALRPGVWLVTAGFSPNPAVRAWMCRFPLVLASPLEDFRLHYASPGIGEKERVIFGEGWANPEGGFRWAAAKRATVTVPRMDPVDQGITVRVLPMAHRTLPAQTLRATLNGHLLGQVTLPNGWSEQSFPAPARLWVVGANSLAFDFGHAVAPADLDPQATDQRALAVSFASIDAGPPFTRVTALIDRKTAWRNTKGRFPPERLRKEGVVPLVARLGFDPAAVWPRLASGEVLLDNLVETAAWGPDCGDERQFQRDAFAALLGREPAPHEIRDLAPLPRVRAVGRIAKWDEFRNRVLVPKATP